MPDSNPFRRPSFGRRSLPALLAAALLPGLACDTPAAPLEEGLDAAVRVSANVVGTPIDIIVVEITGEGIHTPLVYNLDVIEDIAEGTLRMPAGEGRLFEVRAYDDINEVTHEGSLLMDVRRGQNPPVSLPLVPRSGHVPITITMGDYSVVVSPASQTIAAGDVFGLTATVTNPDGSSVPDPVSWATLNPSIATVDADGNVTGVSAGEVLIVATFDGIGGSSLITVEGEGGGGEDPPTVLGPEYPPPGGVTFNSAGDWGRAGGDTWSYSGFNLDAVEAMAWGPSTAFAIGVALDGARDAPGETLVFDPAQSDLATGRLVFTGESTIRVASGASFVAVLVPTRLTLLVSDATGALVLEDGANLGRPEIGGVRIVDDPYTTGSLDVGILFEAQYEGIWEPVLDLYDRLSTDPAIIDPVQTSFGGGFYYVPLP